MTAAIQAIRLPAINPGGQPASNSPLVGKGAEGADFTKAITDALASVGRMENNATAAAEAAAVGDLESVSDYMVAAAEAQMATEITVAVRDRAISAFTDIMRMQI